MSDFGGRGSTEGRENKLRYIVYVYYTGDNTYLSDGLETDTLCTRKIVTILVTAGSDRIHCVYGAIWPSCTQTVYYEGL